MKLPRIASLAQSRRTVMRVGLSVGVAVGMSVVTAHGVATRWLPFGSSAQAQESLAIITVKLAGFRGTEGVALITLYDSEQFWLKVPKAVQVVRAKITAPAMTIDFKDVKPGTYAVSVIHDANQNNKLDMRWLPWPKPLEGVAVSNDPDNKAGPPKWDSAKFVVTANTTVKATVKYVE